MEIEITWKRAAKVWWSYFLKRWMVRFLFIFINYLFISFLINVFLIKNPIIIYTIYIIITIITIVYVEIYPMKIILSKNFGEFRLALVKTTDAEE